MIHLKQNKTINKKIKLLINSNGHSGLFVLKIDSILPWKHSGHLSHKYKQAAAWCRCKGLSTPVFKALLSSTLWLNAYFLDYFTHSSHAVLSMLLYHYQKQQQLLKRYWTFLSFFYVLTWITSFRYLSITYNVFIAGYIIIPIKGRS